MRAQKDCYYCLENLARQTVELTGKNQKQKEELLEISLFYLSENFSKYIIPTVVAGEMQRLIREKANCPDPFANIKQQELKSAAHLFQEFQPSSSTDIITLIDFAIKGNSIDFFVNLEQLRDNIKNPATLTYDDTYQLLKLLEKFTYYSQTPRILYLADNAGECYFDLPLCQQLSTYGFLNYVVKENPVQNDLTLEDLRESNILEHFPSVISSGTDTPGLDIRLASTEFLQLFQQADLIIAKGMGHYETLTEFALPAPTFLLMKAKCKTVAHSLGVDLDSHTVVMLR